MRNIMWRSSLLCVAIVLLPCLVYTDEERVTVTSSCSASNNTFARNITKDNSFHVQWDGDFPFTGQSFCRMNFARAMKDGGIMCVKLSDYRFTADDVYVKLYKNKDSVPMKTLSRLEADYNEDSIVRCGEYFLITVDFGANLGSSSSSVSASHIVVNVYPEIEEGDDDDGGINRWVILSVALSVGIALLSIALAVGCWCVRMYSVSRIQQQERQRGNPQVIYQPSKI